MRQWMVWSAVAVCASSFAGAQSEPALWQYFEGRTVIAKVDLPATKAGLDVYPDSSAAMNDARYGKQLKQFGIAARRNEAVTITDVRVKPKSIEIELAAGDSGSETSPSVYVVAVKSQRERNLENDLQHETDPLLKERMEKEMDTLRQRREREDARLKAALAQLSRANPDQDRQRPQESGARFNLIFPGGVPSRALAPEYIMTALKPWIDFDQDRLSTPVAQKPAARAPEPSPEPPPSLPEQAAHATELHKGLTEVELQHLLGDPVKREPSVEGDLHVEILTFKKDETTVEATMVEGVLVRFRQWSN
jgi:hypothetical protein